MTEQINRSTFRQMAWRVIRPVLIVLSLMLLIAGLIALIIMGYSQAWTGFGDFTYPSTMTVVRGKTLWDWIQLLVVPLFLAIGAWWLNRRDRAGAERAATEEHNRTNERLVVEKAIEANRQREAMLQTYLDRMTELLIRSELRASGDGSEVQAMARARTLTVLRGLDRTRKGLLVRFLHESNLINVSGRVIPLEGADLSEVDLRNAALQEADLHGANLKSAYLGDAELSGADLSETCLHSANLVGATLWKTSLIGADLTKANLTSAFMHKANLHGANLTAATVSTEQLSDVLSLHRATMPDGSKHNYGLPST